MLEMLHDSGLGQDVNQYTSVRCVEEVPGEPLYRSTPVSSRSCSPDRLGEQARPSGLRVERVSIGPPLSLQEGLERERAEEVEAERALLQERVVEQQVQVSRLEAALQAARHRRGSEGEVIAPNTKYNIPNTICKMHRSGGRRSAGGCVARRTGRRRAPRDGTEEGWREVGKSKPDWIGLRRRALDATGAKKYTQFKKMKEMSEAGKVVDQEELEENLGLVSHQW